MNLGEGVESRSPDSFLSVCAAPLASILLPSSSSKPSNWVLSCVDMTFVCLGSENMQNKRSERVWFSTQMHNQTE